MLALMKLLKLPLVLTVRLPLVVAAVFSKISAPKSVPVILPEPVTVMLPVLLDCARMPVDGDPPYNTSALNVIAEVRGARPPDVGNFDSDGAGTGTSALGISYGIVGLVAGLAGLVTLTTLARRRRRPPLGALGKDPTPPRL